MTSTALGGPGSRLEITQEALHESCERHHVPAHLAGMEAELSALLDGRTVILRTQDDLSRYLREDVMRDAELQHAR